MYGTGRYEYPNRKAPTSKGNHKGCPYRGGQRPDAGISMTTLSEADVERAALDWLQGTGWTVRHGPEMEYSSQMPG